MRTFFALLALPLVMMGAPALIAADAQPVPAETLTHSPWPAQWITHPLAPMNEYGVLLFRKTFELTERPSRFVVHVTGDARYRLWVNGEAVSFGPQRSDSWVWHYDSVDLAPWLRAGRNVIATRVVGYGEHAPYATVGIRTGFLLQGDTALERVVDTGPSWKVRRDESIAPVPVKLPTYIVVGPGVRIDGARHPWGWETLDGDESAWEAPRTMGPGTPYGWGTDMNHWLKARTIPAMEDAVVRFASVRRAEPIEPKAGFVSGSVALEIPAHSKATILLDQGVETNAFPRLIVSGGRRGRVSLTYAEALIDEAGNKGRRDEVEGRTIAGITDEFRPDGGERREFGPLDFRTYRYLEIRIETAEDPLRLEDVHGRFTAYPFKENGAFASDDPELKRIWEVGWRTARLCAFETYMDCPYYEQLQYVGDTRIQALISLYVSGDDRLMRAAIELFDRSRIAEGLTQSRYPSVTPQVINTFSLFWIDMVHDYWMHRTDDAFVRARMTGMQSVLRWFEDRIDPQSGLLGPLEYWTFVDWTKEWPWNNTLGIGGEPEGARAGGSSIVSLQLAATLARSAELVRAFGRADLAERYDWLAAGLRDAAIKHCWDETRQLIADSPAKRSFSQHANTMAVLAGAIQGPAAADLMRRVVADRSLVQASTYFRFYLLQAMKRAGLGDAYLAQLGPWREMLALGLTTFAEQPEPTRSDCHAWSASPVYELLATVCGVQPASPGFARVIIEPHLGALRRAEGSVVHPLGLITVSYQRERDGLVARVVLPPTVKGNFVWKGASHALHEGEQILRLP